MVACKSCGLEHSPMIRCEVARNLAERVVRVVGEKEAAARVSQAGEPGRLPEHAPPSKRWNREAYNAYMKEYMRKWRAAKK